MSWDIGPVYQTSYCQHCNGSRRGKELLGKITLYEGHYWRVILPQNPLTEGHLTIMLKEHGASAFDIFNAKTHDEFSSISSSIYSLLKRAYPDCAVHFFEDGRSLLPLSSHLTYSFLTSTKCSYPLFKMRTLFPRLFSAFTSELSDEAFDRQKTELQKLFAQTPQSDALPLKSKS